MMTCCADLHSSLVIEPTYWQILTAVTLHMRCRAEVFRPLTSYHFKPVTLFVLSVNIHFNVMSLKVTTFL